jgi:protein involved in polysaccharide export with SLBB domain
MLAQKVRSLAASALAVGCCATALHAQDRERYTLGEEQKLEIQVHIIGQVQKPGEYRVPDGTNVLELLSRAGGPTEYSDLSEVMVTHTIQVHPTEPSSPHGGAGGAEGSRVSRVNLQAFLTLSKPQTLPVLQPGDVVTIPTNSKSTWKFVSGILRDLSVVASAYFLGVRAFKD